MARAGLGHGHLRPVGRRFTLHGSRFRADAHLVSIVPQFRWLRHLGTIPNAVSSNCVKGRTTMKRNVMALMLGLAMISTASLALADIRAPGENVGDSAA